MSISPKKNSAANFYTLSTIIILGLLACNTSAQVKESDEEQHLKVGWDRSQACSAKTEIFEKRPRLG